MENKTTTVKTGIESREFDWRELYSYYMEKGDRWTAEYLQLGAVGAVSHLEKAAPPRGGAQ